MQIPHVAVAAGFLLCFQGVLAQTINNTPPTASATTAVNGAYQVVTRNGDSRVWQSVTATTNDLGVVQYQNHSYTELATGLCVNSNGVWVDAVPQINLVGDGAETSGTRHFIHWMANANTPNGAVTFVTPNQQTLNSTVFGLL